MDALNQGSTCKYMPNLYGRSRIVQRSIDLKGERMKASKQGQFIIIKLDCFLYSWWIPPCLAFTTPPHTPNCAIPTLLNLQSNTGQPHSQYYTRPLQLICILIRNMLSFPSSEDAAVPQEDKGAASPTSTNVSTHPQPFSPCFFLHPRPPTTPDWSALHDSVLAWLSSRGVVAGRPEELVAEHRESQRKMITLANKKCETDAGSTLGKRLGRKLTITL